MTSGEIFPNRFTRVDELTLPDHWYLTENDMCYYLGEYTARQGYSFSTTNQLIYNFKKSMDRQGRSDWRYKGRAIREAAAAFSRALAPDILEIMTFVPIPPSKVKKDHLYDDRITQMLRHFHPQPSIGVREIIIQKVSTEAVHDSDERPTPEEIIDLYNIDENLAAPVPEVIAVVDDVLTTGAHYRAAQTVLQRRFPEATILGLFIARRAPFTVDLEDIRFD